MKNKAILKVIDSQFIQVYRERGQREVRMFYFFQFSKITRTEQDERTNHSVNI